MFLSFKMAFCLLMIQLVFKETQVIKMVERKLEPVKKGLIQTNPH